MFKKEVVFYFEYEEEVCRVYLLRSGAKGHDYIVLQCEVVLID